LDECPKKLLQSDPVELQTIHESFTAWRHWSKGNMAAFYPDPTDALSMLILWVDEEVASYGNDKLKRQEDEVKHNQHQHPPHSRRPMRRR